MPNAVPTCTHVKANGEVCGSPAVSGTRFCYHHSAVKTALGKATQGKAPYEGFAPIPFLFPEDRASMQINFFLLLQAFNEQRIDQRTYRLMLSMLKAMAKNLGKTGSLVDEPRDQKDEDRGLLKPASGLSGEHKQNDTDRVSDGTASKKAASDETASGEAVSGSSGGKADELESLLDLKASAAIAPESCFSTNPQTQARNTTRDVFATSALLAAGQRSLNRCYTPSLSR